VGCMMRNLEIERLCLAAMSCGIARRCVEVMGRYTAGTVRVIISYHIIVIIVFFVFIIIRRWVEIMGR
jgi:alkylation response protein AidB-like acyl-CoA dehydrogenase